MWSLESARWSALHATSPKTARQVRIDSRPLVGQSKLERKRQKQRQTRQTLNLNTSYTPSRSRSMMESTSQSWFSVLAAMACVDGEDDGGRGGGREEREGALGLKRSVRRGRERKCPELDGKRRFRVVGMASWTRTRRPDDGTSTPDIQRLGHCPCTLRLQSAHHTLQSPLPFKRPVPRPKLFMHQTAAQVQSHHSPLFSRNQLKYFYFSREIVFGFLSRPHHHCHHHLRTTINHKNRLKDGPKLQIFTFDRRRLSIKIDSPKKYPYPLPLLRISMPSMPNPRSHPPHHSRLHPFPAVSLNPEIYSELPRCKT